MNDQLEDSQTRRRSLRRAVQVETDVISNLWDGTVPLLATNLSPHGLWLQSDLPLELGEELLVSLLPPRWGKSEPLTALARVARVGMFRRKRDGYASGMGLRFIDLEREHAEHLQAALRGLPPPLPKRMRATPPPLPKGMRTTPLAATGHLTISEQGRLPQITLADGRTYSFRAEAPLLTAGRAPLLPQPPARIAPVIRLSSPMSAIFDQRHLRAVS